MKQCRRVSQLQETHVSIKLILFENVHIGAYWQVPLDILMDTVMCGVLFQNKNAISLAKQTGLSHFHRREASR